MKGEMMKATGIVRRIGEAVIYRTKLVNPI